MKTVIHFENLLKIFRGFPALRIHDLRIFERETIGFYGLSQEHVELILNQMTGAHLPDEGVVTLLGTDSKEISDETLWFRFVENFGIYHADPTFQEGASIGENIASLFRVRNDSIEEPQLSASVLRLANLVQLTITDLSKMMSEAGSLLRMKVCLCRALAYRPKIAVLCDPTSDISHDVSVKLVELIRRAKRKLKFTLVIFSSDVWFLEQLSDRILFLNPHDGLFIENQLRGWYHTLFPFLNPSSSQLLQLSRDVLQHGQIMKLTEERIGKH